MLFFRDDKNSRALSGSAPNRSHERPAGRRHRHRAAIRADGLAKRYGEIAAVDGLDLEIPSGRVLRPAGAERLRQDDHHPHAGDADPADRRNGDGRRLRRRARAGRACAGRSASCSRSRRSIARSRVAENLRFAGLLHDLPPHVIEERQRRAARSLRPRGPARAARRDAVGRHAPRARHRARRPPPAPRAVPRRADDRTRPAEPPPHLALHRAAARPHRHDGAAHHALSGRGRQLRSGRVHPQGPARGIRRARGCSWTGSAGTSSRSKVPISTRLVGMLEPQLGAVPARRRRRAYFRCPDEDIAATRTAAGGVRLGDLGLASPAAESERCVSLGCGRKGLALMQRASFLCGARARSAAHVPAAHPAGGGDGAAAHLAVRDRRRFRRRHRRGARRGLPGLFWFRACSA